MSLTLSIQQLVFIALIVFQVNIIPIWGDTDVTISPILMKKIELRTFPGAHNPSIIATDQGFLLTFRYLPKVSSKPWISYIGVVLLNDSLEQVNEPYLLNTRPGHSKVPSQAEDARIFSYKGNLYITYNDNTEILNPGPKQRRDIYIAKLDDQNGRFTLSQPKKLCHPIEYDVQTWQKNWVPFEWNGKLLFSYSLQPHEVLDIDVECGKCHRFNTTRIASKWPWGHLRGGTPAQLVDGEYLAFFHSSLVTVSKSSNYVPMHHYYMGAYTFSAFPPFGITGMIPFPIICEEFYTESDYGKRVIFPGGYVLSNSKFYVAYGKDDAEVWVAVFDKNELMRRFVSMNARSVD